MSSTLYCALHSCIHRHSQLLYQQQYSPLKHRPEFPGTPPNKAGRHGDYGAGAGPSAAGSPSEYLAMAYAALHKNNTLDTTQGSSFAGSIARSNSPDSRFSPTHANMYSGSGPSTSASLGTSPHMGMAMTPQISACATVAQPMPINAGSYLPNSPGPSSPGVLSPLSTIPDVTRPMPIPVPMPDPRFAVTTAGPSSSGAPSSSAFPNTMGSSGSFSGSEPSTVSIDSSQTPYPVAPPMPHPHVL